MGRNTAVKMHVFSLEVLTKNDITAYIRITNDIAHTELLYYITTPKIEFTLVSPLNKLLHSHISQLQKILNVRDDKTLFPGFKLKFAIRENKDVEGFNDKSRIMVIDKRNGKDENYLITKGVSNIHEIYTDGSYAEQKNKGGYTVIIRYPDGEYELYTMETYAKSSCLIELKAAIKGLELLKPLEKVRVVTDSQYVRKGLTEWILNWKLNGWRTARGKRAKNIGYWKYFDRLTQGKYIELQWVKGHSDHFENTMCDLYAKDMANNRLISEQHKPKPPHLF